jgi:hypothetical protein
MIVANDIGRAMRKLNGEGARIMMSNHYISRLRKEVCR